MSPRVFAQALPRPKKTCARLCHYDHTFGGISSSKLEAALPKRSSSAIKVLRQADAANITMKLFSIPDPHFAIVHLPR